MNYRNPEYNTGTHESDKLTFVDKFRNLLPGVEFEESPEMFEARIAVLEALKSSQNPDFLQSVWIEYANVCEQFVDNKTNISPQARAQLQIVALVHKALIFRELEDIQRYGEDLSDAEEYAFNMHFEEIGEAISAELDRLN